MVAVPPRPPIPPNRGKRANVRTYSAWEWSRAYLAWVGLLPVYLALWLFATVFKKLPDSWHQKLLRAHIDYTDSHPMDFRIPPTTTIPAYMFRWWRIPRNWAINIYYHIVLRGDDDRALHDHPWWSFSIVLDGGYYEHTIDAGGVHQRKWYAPGSVRFRRSGTFAHRLELAVEHATGKPWTPEGPKMPARTIFITGPVLRRWGFHHSKQWVDAYEWDDFTRENGLRNSMPMDGGSDGAISPRNKI